MKKNIVVVGCGLGGLSFAYNYAKNGGSVIVYEKQFREQLGYDWEDCIRRDSFDKSGIPSPDKKNLIDFYDIAYSCPSKKVLLAPKHPSRKNLCMINRRFLINYLINLCADAGVEFKFGCEVISTITDGDVVEGVLLKENGKIESITTNLVVDAAGVDSPVRKSLPKSIRIQKNFNNHDLFYVYRAYHEYIGFNEAKPEYTCYFFHNNRNGMDWCIQENGYADILIGGFGSLVESDVSAGVDDFKNIYPGLKSEIKCGGSYEVLPLSRMLPKIVAHGYAAIGNSAAMTEPMSGSGITMSMNAGKILSDAVLEANGIYSLDNLWKYQYKYFSLIGRKQLNNDSLKKLLSKLDYSDIDYLMESGILGSKEIAGLKDPYTFGQLVNKITALLKNPLLIYKIKGLPINIIRDIVSSGTMPQKYNKLFKLWKIIYWD